MKLWQLYIPIWLCSNKERDTKLHHLFSFTFQSGYVQMLYQTCNDKRLLFLYIPIWLCSNDGGGCRTCYSIVLYIPIWLCSNDTREKPKTYTVKSFTFQSGYVQMEKLMKLDRNKLTLHSNLVMFKLEDRLGCNLSIEDFTFQSGYVQIRPYHTTYLCRLKSTFLSTDK